MERINGTFESISKKDFVEEANKILGTNYTLDDVYDDVYDDTDEEICTCCNTLTSVYGYCEDDGAPFCEQCWNGHVVKCIKCSERN